MPSLYSLLAHLKPATKICLPIIEVHCVSVHLDPRWALATGKKSEILEIPKLNMSKKSIEETKIYLSLTRFDIGADFLAGSALKCRTKWTQQTKTHSWIICLHIFRFDSHQICPIIIQLYMHLEKVFGRHGRIPGADIMTWKKKIRGRVNWIS